MENLKLLLLDFDGTLVNTGRANAVSYIEALAEEGIRLSLETYRSKYFGLRCSEFMADLGIESEKADRIRKRKIEIYPTHFDLVSLNRPLWDFVQDFRSHGGKAWIVSTGHIKNVTNVMKHLNLEDGIDGILSADDVIRSKPSPDCFLLAMERNGCSARETLIFEDSEIGLRAAELSGAPFVKVSLPF